MKNSDKNSFLILTVLCVMAVFSSSLHAQELNTEQTNRIKNAKQGGILYLDNFLSSNKFTELNYKKVVLPGPQFIISDDPEYIRVPEAIALREAVQPGAVRLYVYNVNGVKEPNKIARKITAVIKNTGTGIMHLRMLKYASEKPSGNYFQIGKQGLADYFASVPENMTRSVKPGEAIAIDEKLEKNSVNYDELVHGFYEFVIDQPGEISVIQTDPKTPGPLALKRIKTVLPTSHNNAGRGLFGVSNYQVITGGVLDTKNGVTEIIMADGKKDPWVKGVEGGSGDQAELAGNYGVMYHVKMKWKSSDGKGLALVTWNSRSGDSQWCGGMAATMVVSKGKFDQGIIKLPSDQLVTKGAQEAILIQVFPPSADGAEQTIDFTYSPPGASCLPTPLVFIPVDLK
ncbi:MAG: copper amine oxidase [Mucilaginibacter sp.]|nr:copper amine oxidase [Mucilaginibacter sp.]